LKILGRLITALAFCLASSASVHAAGLPDAACVPYSIPIQSTVTACGPGMTGAKYKTSTKSCPSGTVTVSTEYDTSGCLAAPPAAGSVNYSTRCALTPDACAGSPVAAGCPAGYHWTLVGSNVAHCVADDPSCPWGTSLRHDSMGNPSCTPNTCPSNQVLQSDGASCACPTNTTWNGGSCVAAPPSCVESSQAANTMACGAGFTGTMYQVQSTTCPSGPYGSPTTTMSDWVRTNCVAAAPTCAPSTGTESTTCGDPSKYTGAMYRTITTSCPSGAYGASSSSYGSWDTGGCGCANGALNFPTCTPLVAVPPANPYVGASVPSWIYSASDPNRVLTKAGIILKPDGTWSAYGSALREIGGSRYWFWPVGSVSPASVNGRWFASNAGSTGSQFEVMWQAQDIGSHYTAYVSSISPPEGEWMPLSSNFQFEVVDSVPGLGGCVEDTLVYKILLIIRRKSDGQIFQQIMEFDVDPANWNSCG